MSRRPSGAAVLAAAALGLTLAACDDSPVGVDPFGTVACEPPPVSLVPATVEGISRQDLRIAVEHAATVLTSSFPGGEQANLRAKMQPVLSELSDNPQSGLCRALDAASAALGDLPDTPATRPDRAAIRLILDMVALELAR